MGNHKVISETWKGSGSAEPLARGLRALGGVINNPQGVNGINAYVRGGRLVIEGTGSGMDFSQFTFGFSIKKDVVTIKAGDWPFGETEVEMQDTDVTITADLQYVGLEVDTVAKTIVVIGPSTNKAVFSSNSPKFRVWLHQFRFNGRNAFLKRTNLAALFMPGRFGG